MKATAYPAPGEPPRIVFRTSIVAPLTVGMMAALVAYFPVRTTFDTQYPFAIACGIGLAVGLGLVAASARRGIEVSAEGLRDLGRGVLVRWSEVDAIRVELAQPSKPNRPPLRVVTVAAADGRSIRFADQASGISEGAQGIVPVEHAALLLAIIAQRTQGRDLFPPAWLEPVAPGPAGEAVQPRDSQRVPLRVHLMQAWGLIPLLLKVLKSVKPAWLLGSFALYSVVFSWEFALAFLAIIGFHECGHVFAMYRCGIPVKGIYFIPFFGGAAVSKGIARTRRDEAYIVANGPLWGTLLVFACLAAYVVTGGAYPVLAAAGAWGALINLFNLLPILPLDGGRLLNDLAYSLGTGLGNVLVFASLLFGAAFAYLWGYELLVLMVLVGLLEYVGHLSASVYKPARAWFEPAQRLSAEALGHFEGFVQPVRAGARSPRQLEDARGRMELRLRQAELLPMNGGQCAAFLALYAGLAGMLLLAMHLAAGLPGHGSPLELLR